MTDAIASMGSLDEEDEAEESRGIPSLTVNDIIEQAIIEINYGRISAAVLARIAGLTDPERELMELVFDENFNESEFLLTKEIAEKYLSRRGPNALSHIYDKLESIPRDSYREVTADDPLVQNYISSRFPRSGNRTTTFTYSKSRWIIVTGEGFQHLLMLSTSDTAIASKGYYVKLNRVAAAFKGYLMRANEHKDMTICQLSDTVTSVTREKASLERRHKLLLKRRSYPLIDQHSQGPCFYILRNTMEMVGRYKIGIAKCIDKRLRSHRTDIPFAKLAAVYYTENNREVERAVKKRLMQLDLLSPPSHEFTKDISEERLISMVEDILILFEYSKADEDMLEDYNQEILMDDESDDGDIS